MCDIVSSRREKRLTFGVRDADMLAGLMKQCSSLSQQELEAMGKKSLELIHGLSLDTFADSVIAASSLPRRDRGNIVSNLITKLWTGRISFYP